MIGVDSFLAILATLLDLARGRRRAKERLFADVIQPLFDEVQPVVDEYLRFFQRARRRLERGKKANYGRLAFQLSAERKELATVRVKVVEVAKAIRARTRADAVKDFALAVERLFDATVIKEPVEQALESEPTKPRASAAPGRNGKLTKRKDLVRRVYRARKVPVPKSELLGYIDEVLEEVEQAFVEVAARYAALRVYCLKV